MKMKISTLSLSLSSESDDCLILAEVYEYLYLPSLLSLPKNLSLVLIRV